MKKSALCVPGCVHGLLPGRCRLPPPQQTDERLAAVTAQVKQTLNLDHRGLHGSFMGELDDNPLSPTWVSGLAGGKTPFLTVTATEQGGRSSATITLLPPAQSSSSQFPPSFPEGDRGERQGRR